MLNDIIANECIDCGEVAFVFDKDGFIELMACSCVDGMNDLDWVNE